jgi:hypothetical protein
MKDRRGNAITICKKIKQWQPGEFGKNIESKTPSLIISSPYWPDKNVKWVIIFTAE